MLPFTPLHLTCITVTVKHATVTQNINYKSNYQNMLQSSLFEGAQVTYLLHTGDDLDVVNSC